MPFVAIFKFIFCGGVGAAVGIVLQESPFGPVVGAYVAAALMGLVEQIGKEADNRNPGAWILLFLIALGAAALLFMKGQG